MADSGICRVSTALPDDGGHAARRADFSDAGEPGTGRTGGRPFGTIHADSEADDRKEGASGAVCRRLRDHGQLERVAGKRGETVRGSVSERTGSSTLTGEDRGHAYGAGLRFPGAERTKVRWQAAHQTLRQERASVSGKGEGNHQGTPSHETGRPDRSAQPDDPGVGAVSPAHRGKGGVLRGGLADMAFPLAMGKTSASQEIGHLDQGEVLPTDPEPQLGIQRQGPGAPRAHQASRALQSV